jgi:2,3-bisphosphoglycerate-dependent phosphoglycerate mutase
MIVHLVRHGQSYNTHPLPDDPDPTNPPLNPVGRAQAARVAERLRALPIARLVASPMIRTIETARAIGDETDLPVEVWPDCYEFRETPAYDCVGGRELARQFPGLVVDPDFAPDGWVYGSEALASGIGRADGVLARLRALSAGESASRTVIVSHGDFIDLLLYRALGVTPARPFGFVIDNTSVSTLEVSPDGIRVLGVNDSGHLADALVGAPTDTTRDAPASARAVAP